MAGWMTAQQAVGVPLSSVALDSASFVAQVCARTGTPDHALSACWPTVAHSAPMYLAELLHVIALAPRPFLSLPRPLLAEDESENDDEDDKMAMCISPNLLEGGA